MLYNLFTEKLIGLQEAISYTSEYSIPQFLKCAQTIQNWLPGILNSFDTTVTNGLPKDATTR